MHLRVVDANGLEDETYTRIDFVQKNTTESRDGCPRELSAVRISDFKMPGTVFTRLTNTATTYTLPIPCVSIYPCIGAVTGRVKRLRARTSAAATSKDVVVFEGPVSIRPETSVKLRGKLTAVGRRLLKRQKRLKVRVTVQLFTPTGQRVRTTRTATLKRPAKRR